MSLLSCSMPGQQRFCPERRRQGCRRRDADETHQKKDLDRERERTENYGNRNESGGPIIFLHPNRALYKKDRAQTDHEIDQELITGGISRKHRSNQQRRKRNPLDTFRNGVEHVSPSTFALRFVQNARPLVSLLFGFGLGDSISLLNLSD